MEKKLIPGDTVKKCLKTAERDRLYRFLLSGGAVRGALVHGMHMVQEMRANHELGLMETLILGHAYMGGLLVASSLKGEDRVALKIECSGPVQGLVVEANARGEVRGYLQKVPIPVKKPPEDFNMSPFFGAGFISVTRYLRDAKHPFTGKVALQHGNIAQDLAHYYLASEQIPTAFSLSVKFTSDGEVAGAGGLFLQVMPGATDTITAELEKIVYDLPSLGDVCTGKEDMEGFLQTHFAALRPDLLDKPRVAFFCPCRREGVMRVLRTLPVEDLKDLCENGPFPVELRCHHCNTIYNVNRNEMQVLYLERINPT